MRRETDCETRVSRFRKIEAIFEDWELNLRGVISAEGGGCEYSASERERREQRKRTDRPESTTSQQLKSSRLRGRDGGVVNLSVARGGPPAIHSSLVVASIFIFRVLLASIPDAEASTQHRSDRRHRESGSSQMLGGQSLSGAVRGEEQDLVVGGIESDPELASSTAWAVVVLILGLSEWLLAVVVVE